ncbi:HD domain-containing protein [Anaerovorax sp. IOR16]|uniref:HD domain-containing protein n=1 Tax=Anaerovorax sp. IOR16 TaxID=2773458 RepID=UPI0019D25986|nr:HD domain-containing protein [Anaerovorax sp. IOR16]
MCNKKQIFESISQHLMKDEAPSNYINRVFKLKECKTYPFSMLLDLQSTEQSPIHHPEGSAWNHTMLVVDEAARRKNQSHNPSVFMWAALLHDIGKPSTTKSRKGKITSYNHDKIGADLAKDFLSVFTEDDNFIDKVSALIRYHMHILFVTRDLPFSDLKGLKQQTDIHEVALLGLCDRLGRTNANLAEEEKNIKLFLKKSNFEN